MGKASAHAAQLTNKTLYLTTSRIDPDSQRYPKRGFVLTKVAKEPPEVDVNSPSSRLFSCVGTFLVVVRPCRWFVVQVATQHVRAVHLFVLFFSPRTSAFVLSDFRCFSP